jgi:glutathione S-transferase
MKLFGTVPSPFTRRVRIVAAELGEPIEWTDTSTEAGQAALREVSPVRKVPVAVVDGRTLFDSRVIVDWLIATRGYGAMAPPRDPWRERNQLTAVDEATLSIVQVFSARRDGVAIDGTRFAQRQFDRADAIFGWLAKELAADPSIAPPPPTTFGLVDAWLVSALDWMDFRKSYPTERAAGLVPIRAAWAQRASVASTRPDA